MKEPNNGVTCDTWMRLQKWTLIEMGVKLPPKFLNVYDFGMKMYTSMPITAFISRKAVIGQEQYIFMPKSYTFRSFYGISPLPP